MNITESNVSQTLIITQRQQQSMLRAWDHWDISLLLLLIFGLVGNLLSIVVMSRKRMRNTNASLFVTSMAISDCLFLSIKFLSNMVKLYRIPVYSWCIFVHNVLPHTTLFVSGWLVILTALERTVAVLYPFRVAELFSHFRCKLLIGFICAFFFLLSSSLTPCLEAVVEKPYFCKIKGHQNGTCFHFYNYAFPWISVSFGAWIPSIIGFVLNILIAVGLCSASRARESISAESNIRKPTTERNLSKPLIGEAAQSNTNTNGTSSFNNTNHYRNSNNSGVGSSAFKPSNQKQITIMLMTISVSYMLLSFPYSAFELMRKLDVHFEFLRSRVWLRFVLLLVDIHHATNFILYCLTGQKFRDELNDMVLGKCDGTASKRRRDIDRSTNQRHSSAAYTFKSSTTRKAT